MIFQLLNQIGYDVGADGRLGVVKVVLADPRVSVLTLFNNLDPSHVKTVLSSMAQWCTLQPRFEIQLGHAIGDITAGDAQHGLCAGVLQVTWSPLGSPGATTALKRLQKAPK